MTDKERILTYIIQYFYPKYILGNEDKKAVMLKGLGDIKVGDLVIALTSGVHSFTIGYVTDITDKHEMKIREVGGNRVCNIGNELFYKIDTDTIDKKQLLEGLQYEIYLKTIKALKKSEYEYNYTLIEFQFLDKEVIVYFRERGCDYIKETAPKISFKYTKKTTLKEITEKINQMYIVYKNTQKSILIG